jgi:hypothetical protein
MVKRILKEKAFELRKESISYSEIKTKLTFIKSTLSIWLRDLPLSSQRIKELRDNSPKRIERYRNTIYDKSKKGRKTFSIL